MNPGMVVKLRPTGPWRIGPDSGARNRVDAIYHSDSLYAAVTSAMARLGSLEEWLGATARNRAPAVCFSSCFPFLDEIGFVVPPRSVWPPTSPALLSARVRWKTARFVPLGIVQAVLAGQTLHERDWAIDGPSECLVPAGKPGPFRTGLRWNAAIDRMTGVSERHFTACVEFRPGAGLWTVVSFADDAARDRWSGPVKTAFRWLADSGFGGERSRGWGRAEAPEFVEGVLPEMILGQGSKNQGSGVRDQGSGEPAVVASGPDVSPLPPVSEPAEPSPVPPIEEPVEPPPPDPDPVPPAPEPEPASAEAAPVPESTPEPPIPDPRPLTPAGASPHWLLSLFTPGAGDTVDWSRGSYSMVTRGGRVDASGDLKKFVQMVAEGSVIYAAEAPRGGAPDVAPEGFSHPVFRAGFALAIPLSGQEGHPL
jgi:CRISPR type III-A-associated RAMP protein Csm4